MADTDDGLMWSDTSFAKLWSNFCIKERSNLASYSGRWYSNDTDSWVEDYEIFLKDLAREVPRAQAFAVEFAKYRLKG